MRLKDKLNHLIGILSSFNSVVVAFSGGADSALLAVLANDVLKGNCIAVTFASPIHDSKGILTARRLAEQQGLKHALLRSKTTGNKRFIQNGQDRCYVCKRDIFSRMIAYAKEHGVSTVLDGSNADDLKAYRPGRKALKELKVRSPLAEAGLTKSEIRRIARRMKISVWNEPANACLATRIPYGTRITDKTLKQIERAEGALAVMGFRQYRVRHHGHLARIELPAAQFNQALKMKDRIIHALQAAGYEFITLDLAGYRSGCFDRETAIRKDGKR